MTKKSVSCNVRENPFPYSDTNRRFYTFDYYMRKIFGKKCAKVPQKRRKCAIMHNKKQLQFRREFFL